MLRHLIIASLVAVSCAFADEEFPRAGWESKPNPLASADAVRGGQISLYAGPYPKSFNYYLDLNTVSSEIFGSLFETLLTQNPATLELEPGLADRWILSDDKQTFTFHLDSRAKWSDGRAITASDVKWTFDAILNEKNLTGPHKIDLLRFDAPEVIGEDSIRFHARDAHWKNLLSVGFFHILPSHILATQDFNKVNFEFPVVSGAYRLGELKEGLSLVLEQREDWWFRDDPRATGSANFARLRYMFFEEEDNAFEAFKKGSIDYFPVHTAHRWVSQTTGEKFEQQWIVKQRVRNYNPIGFQGFAMNMRRAPFNDQRVRLALAHLLDRPRMNATLMHNQYFLHRSYFEDLYDPEHPCPNPLIEFDPAKAASLLDEAGWKVNPESGIREKDGQKLACKFLTRDSSSDKFLVIYQQDLKTAGIELSIEQKDWAAWLKDMDEFNFDMTWAAWSGSVWKDPESMWLSTEADRLSGQNVTGLKDPDVDALIEQQKTEFDLAVRNEICRKIDAKVSAAVPYVLLWNLNYSRILYWNRFGMPATVLGKYGDERAASGYWWLDEDAAAELDAAMANGQALPARPAEVDFDTAR